MKLYNKTSFQGKVEELLLRETRDDGFVKVSSGKIELKFSGPVGDCHTGLTRPADSRTLALYPRNLPIRNVRQMTILSAEELEKIAANMDVPKIEAAWFGANMVVSGIPDFTLLPPSTRLRFPSGAVLVVDMENLPCSQIAAVVESHYPQKGKFTVKAAMHLRGVTAWVEAEGFIEQGAAVEVFLPPQRHYQHS